MLNDIRYALRTFTRLPGFALTAAFTLAVGIGANTAIFSVVYALLLKPLPFRDPERLIYAHDTFATTAVASVSWPKFLALRDGNRTLDALATTNTAALTITGRGEPQQVFAPRVSGDFFKVLGVTPLAGRGITPADDVPNGAPVIVLTYGLWQRAFGGNPAVIGEAITTDGIQRTIVGVMPPDFVYPPRAEAWVPLAIDPGTQNGNFLRIIGRMKAGVTLRQATDDLTTVTARFNKENGVNRSVRVWRLHEYLSQTNRQMVLVLQGAVLLVLLVACANVANMLLARSVSRRRELAIRLAIGADPLRLLRQLLTESVILAAFGGALGVLVGGWLLRLFLSLAPAGFAGVQHIAIDRHVLLFTTVVAMLTGIVFGIAPARRAFHADAADGLRDATARGSSSSATRGASRLLVVGEVALAVMLVVGAGLLVKSLLRLQSQNAGLHADGLLTFQIALPAARYDDDKLRLTLTRILDEMRSLPGVRAAGAINFLPLTSFGFSGPFSIPGRPPVGTPDRPPVIEYRVVTPGYFAAMGIPVRRGAEFTARHSQTDRPVVLINETMARQFWPNENPIGVTINLGMDRKNLVREIVGVVGDVRSASLRTPPVPEAYVPHAQIPADAMGIAVRTEGEPGALLAAVRQRLAAIDPDIPIVRPQTMNAVLDASTGSMRLSSMLTSVFAVLAALLASVGIYSLVSYSVASRTREIGIRVALGATPSSVLRLVIGEGLGLAAAGLAVGLAVTWSLTGALKSLLFEVSPIDPLVLAATGVAVLALTACASFAPAWRVMRVDPTIALRTE
ncbi:MAG TPA: ABC transporter permease [Vicinamibacterales bacterium]|nr:ABC transporter permease [Vicinamibacterales bacterium]